MKVVIQELSEENFHDFPIREYPYTVWGRLRLRFDGAAWSYAEEPMDCPYSKLFPEEDDRAEYLHEPDKTGFLAYADGAFAGSVKLERAWNRYAFIWDIGVVPEARGKGVGTALLAAAEQWAREHDLSGLALEAQDVNLTASRFYEKHGFVIGGVNTRLYSNFLHCAHEIAVFWYKPFSGAD